MLENENRGGYETTILHWGRIIQVLLMNEIDMKSMGTNNIFKE